MADPPLSEVPPWLIGEASGVQSWQPVVLGNDNRSNDRTSELLLFVSCALLPKRETQAVLWIAPELNRLRQDLKP